MKTVTRQSRILVLGLLFAGLACFGVVGLSLLGGCPPARDSGTNSDNGASGDGQNGDADANAGGDQTSDGNQDDGSGNTGGQTDTNPGGQGHAGAIVADHLAAGAFDALPTSSVQQAGAQLRIFYGHTSHGSQVVTGMTMIHAENSTFTFNDGPGTLSVEETDGDLGSGSDTAWVDTTRARLNQPGSDINVVTWSWCGGVSSATADDINAYLAAMSQLEADYPAVTFIYMTGHLDGTGPAGNLYARNNQIRDYCRAHAKVLFDFADIESYDPGGTYYPDGSEAAEWCATWCAAHACPECSECAHSACCNCYQKGKAFWWLLGRLAGWSGA
jgi:hypothetical protein